MEKYTYNGNTKTTAIEWLVDRLEHFGNKHELQVSWATVDELVEQAKEMEKTQIIDAINKVSQNNVKFANQIISSLSPIEGELFTHNEKLAEQYFNETYGGNENE
jgi:hypothetical protein